MLALIQTRDQRDSSKQRSPEIQVAAKAEQLQCIEFVPGPGKMTKREHLPEKNAELSGENAF